MTLIRKPYELDVQTKIKALEFTGKQAWAKQR